MLDVWWLMTMMRERQSKMGEFWVGLWIIPTDAFFTVKNSITIFEDFSVG